MRVPRSGPKHRPRNRRPCRLGWHGLLIAVVVGTSAAFSSAQGLTATRPDSEVDVRVYAEPALPDSTQRHMRATADGILRAAGRFLHRWHDCPVGATDPQCARSLEKGVVSVRVVAGHATPAATCGRAAARRARGRWSRDPVSRLRVGPGADLSPEVRRHAIDACRRRARPRPRAGPRDRTSAGPIARRDRHHASRAPPH